MKKIVIAAALTALALASHAESPGVGKLSSVQGTVTVGVDGQAIKAVNGTVLKSNSTILVASGAKATVVLDEGCVISLRANQYLALNPKLTCSQQVAAVSQLAAPYRTAQAPVGSAAAAGGGAAVGAGGSLLIAGGIVAAGVVVVKTTDTDPPSGS